jgi:quercetin dioxygenase-like cupin family protein
MRPVVHPDGERAAPRSPEHFIGRVRHDDLAAAAGGTDSYHLMAVFFDAGSRTRPHLHAYDQVLMFVEGPGIVAVDGGEDQVVETGGIVLLPANVPHMHGATDNAPAMHITFGGLGGGDFTCPIAGSWRRFRDG